MGSQKFRKDVYMESLLNLQIKISLIKFQHIPNAAVLLNRTEEKKKFQDNKT